MFKKLIYLISFILSLGVLQAVPAEAQSIEFEFGGTVTSIDPGISGCDPNWGDVNVGNYWSITYTFDSTVSDTDGASDHGWYAAITSYTLNVGGNIVDDSGLAGELISIFNNKPAGWDQYEVYIALPGGTYDWFMQLDDNTNTAWDTDELPLCGDIELSNFSLRDFTLSEVSGPGGCEIRGSVDWHTCTPLVALGLPHTALGQAQLAIVNSNLVVSNIGSSGEDGVAIDLGESEGMFLGFGNSGALGQVGARIVMEAFGKLPGDPNTHQSLSTLTYENMGSTSELSVDFSPLGAATFRAKIYNNGTLVHEANGLNSGIAVTTTGELSVLGPGDPFEGIDVTLIKKPANIAVPFDPPVDFDVSDGTGLHTGDEVVLITEGETVQVEFVSRARIQAADTQDLTLVDVKLLGCATFIPGDTNRDCYVNFLDVAILAGNWLKCNDPTNINCTWEP